MHALPGGTQMPQLLLQHSRPAAQVTLPQLTGAGAHAQSSQPSAPRWKPNWHASVQTTGEHAHACCVHAPPVGTQMPQLALQHSVPGPQVLKPHAWPLPASAFEQNCCVHAPVGVVQMPQLALQQTSPTAQVLSPHFGPVEPASGAGHSCLVQPWPG